MITREALIEAIVNEVLSTASTKVLRKRIIARGLARHMSSPAKKAARRRNPVVQRVQSRVAQSRAYREFKKANGLSDSQMRQLIRRNP